MALILLLVAVIIDTILGFRLLQQYRVNQLQSIVPSSSSFSPISYTGCRHRHRPNFLCVGLSSTMPSVIAANEDQSSAPTAVDIQFSHIQLYVDTVHPIVEYKMLEASITKFQELFPMNDSNGFVDTSSGEQVWRSMMREERLQKEADEEMLFDN